MGGSKGEVGIHISDVSLNRGIHLDALELGGTQILETVRYFIKYHGINNYHGILINTFMYPVKYSNNFK